MSAPTNREETIFERALGMDSPQAREAYLRDACGEDTALRERLQRLLAAHDRAGRFLEHNAPQSTAPSPDAGAPSSCSASDAASGSSRAGARRSDRVLAEQPGVPLWDSPHVVGGSEAQSVAPFSEKAGDRIGRYKLLEQIGEGGMGIVWMAEQEEPVRRRVALKVIKLGMDTRQVLARFEAERQALALMDHPNIAKVFDGGATGVSLGAPASSRPAGPPQEPAGKMPALPADGPAESQISTASSQLPPGRPYFVMELVRGLPITKYCEETKMSTRERLELFGQVCRAVQHAHQKGIIHRDLKPSNILVTVQDDRPVVKVIDFGIAKATEGRLTDKTLFTGFDQLMGTPAYMSPEQAGLGGLDVDTRSDTYSLGVVLYQLLTGRTPFDTKELLKSGYEAVLRTIREVDPPKPSTRLTDLVAADVRRLTSDSKGRNPKSEEDRASLRRLLQQEKELLSAIRGDLDWIVMKCLEKDRARRYETPNGLAQDLERYLHDEPVLARPPSALYRWQKFARKHRTAVMAGAALLVLLVMATAVSTALGLWANRERGRAENAQKAESAQRAAAEAERNRATSAEAQANENARKAGESEAEARAVTKFFQERVLAAAGPKGTKWGLGKDTTIRAAVDAAEPTITNSFANQPRLEAAIRDTLGWAFYDLGDFASAIHQLERTLVLRRASLGSEHEDTFDTLKGLCVALVAHGRAADARPLLEESLKSNLARHGPDHTNTLSLQHNLADVYKGLGKVREAAALMEQTLEQRKRTLGVSDPDTLRSMSGLGELYRETGRPADAVPLLEEALRHQRAGIHPDHMDILGTINNLALAYRQLDRLPEALPLFEEAAQRFVETRGLDHPRAGVAIGNLAGAYFFAERYTNAEPLLQQAVELQRKTRAPDDPVLGNILLTLGECRLKLKRYSAAEESLRECLPILEKRQSSLNAEFKVQRLLGAALLGQGKHADAEPLLLKAHEALAQREAQRPSRSRSQILQETAERIVQLYEAWGKPEQATQWRAKLSAAPTPPPKAQP